MGFFPTIDVQLKFDGVNWTSVIADVRASMGLHLAYGMPDGKPTTRVAKAGMAGFWLDNSALNSQGLQGAYSFNNVNRRTGFVPNVKCRIKFTYSAVTYYKFVGRIKEIRSLAGQNQEQYTACVAYDFMDDMARASITGLSTQVNKRFDQILTTLIAAMSTQPESMSFDVGISTFKWGMVGGSGGVINPLQEAQRLAMSEFGRIYVKGDTTAGGVLRAENRHTRASITSSVTLDNTMGPNPAGTTPLMNDQTIDAVLNHIEVTTRPRKVDGSVGAEVVLYSSLTAGSTTPTALTPGQSTTINAPYRDPSQTVSTSTRAIAGTSMLSPVATTDYLANAQADGLGANLTANLGVVVVFGSTGATITLTNNGASTLYITKLQLRGVGLYDYDMTTAISNDTASQAQYGLNTLAIDMSYESDPTVAQSVADTVRLYWAAPFGLAQKVAFVGNLTDALMTAALAKEIGDRITIKEQVTGLNADFFINGVQFDVMEGPTITCSWVLCPNEFTATWFLGVTNSAELGVASYLSGF